MDRSPRNEATSAGQGEPGHPPGARARRGARRRESGGRAFAYGAKEGKAGPTPGCSQQLGNMAPLEGAVPVDLGRVAPISLAEAAKLVKKLLGGKAPVLDEIRPEMLKALDIVGLSWITRLFNVSWGSGTVPMD